jgi:hypothetical protein
LRTYSELNDVPNFCALRHFRGPRIEFFTADNTEPDFLMLAPDARVRCPSKTLFSTLAQSLIINPNPYNSQKKTTGTHPACRSSEPANPFAIFPEPWK